MSTEGGTAPGLSRLAQNVVDAADSLSLAEQKGHLRALARSRRIAVENAAALSREILDRAFALAPYQLAKTVMFYVDAGSEVQTRARLPEVLATGRTLVVPWCDGDELRLFRLQAMDELTQGSYNILEPRLELRRRPERQAEAELLDIVFTPGVAFDPHGRRLGQGRGYYDRLLPRLRREATIVGLAFEAQIFPELPIAEHDVQMHYVVTEAATYAVERPGTKNPANRSAPAGP